MKTFKYETQEQKNQLVKEFFGSGKNCEDFCEEKEFRNLLFTVGNKNAKLQKKRLYFFFLSPKKKKKKEASSEICTSKSEIRLEIGNMKLYLTEQTSLSFFRQVLQEVKNFALSL